MKSGFFQAFFIVAVLTACNSSSEPHNAASDTSNASTGTVTVQPAAIDSGTVCYQYAGAGDTIHLRIGPAGIGRSGPLEYRLKEKDRNSGLFTVSSDEGGLLRGWYRFQSEGMESVREEVFRRQGDALVPGYGPVQQSADTVRFEQGAQLRFDSSRVLRRIACAR